jgi:hypothetical protein
MVFEFQTFSGGLGVIDPILISVAVDKKIIVWDLHTLFANNQGVGGDSLVGGSVSAQHTQTNSAAVYSLFASSNSGGGGSVQATGTSNSHSHEYLLGNAYTAIPTFGAVEQAFALDKQEKSLGVWPRLSKLVENYGGSAILALATRLFYQVGPYATLRRPQRIFTVFHL